MNPTQAAILELIRLRRIDAEDRLHARIDAEDRLHALRRDQPPQNMKRELSLNLALVAYWKDVITELDQMTDWVKSHG